MTPSLLHFALRRFRRMISWPLISTTAMGLVLSAGSAIAETAQTTLASGNGLIAPIILSGNAAPNTVSAVQKLAAALEQMTGLRPQILTTAPSPMPASAVWIGNPPGLTEAMPGIDLKVTRPEEIVIAIAGGHVAIAGVDKLIGEAQVSSGTANAIYTFMQNMLGIRWFWPGPSGTDIPLAKTLSLPDQIFRFAPAFLQRDLLSNEKNWGPELKEWCIRQRLYFDSYTAPRDHTFSEWWDKYRDSHPEYFALQPNGTRSGYPAPKRAKVSEGEPGVWRQWLENVVEAYQANPTIRVFGASQNDSSNSGICMDPRSTAWDHPDGILQQYAWEDRSETYVAMSDRMVQFLNTLGKSLEERFPGEALQVLGLAYGPSKPGPVEARTGKNVVIGYVGQFPTSGEKWRELEKAQFSAWAAKADLMVFRPNLFYYSGGWHGLPVITINALQEDFRFLADNHCLGILVDGVPGHWGPQGLEYYLMAQLMWDPHANAEELAQDYCLRAFGPAGKKIREYYALMEKAHNVVVNHPQWFPGMGTTRDPLSEIMLPAAYTPETLAEGDLLLSQAAENLKDSDPVFRNRLELLQRSQEFLRLMMDTILTMNDVRHSNGRNVTAVEKAERLAEARETFFAEEQSAEKTGRRPAAVNAHRIRTTWIESRNLQNWLGPVSPDYLQAAAQAKAAGKSEVSNWRTKLDAPQTLSVRLTNPLTLRWTGSAKDGQWENRGNWESLTMTSEWVPAPSPPEDGAKVELSDAAGPGWHVIRLGRDVELESLTIRAAMPETSFQIKNRLDTDNGIDADSSRVSTLVLRSATPIVQTAKATAGVEFEIPVRFAHPAAKMDLRSEGGAKVMLNSPAASPPAQSSGSQAPERLARDLPILAKGPIVLFGDSTTALRSGIKTYSEEISQMLGGPVGEKIINAGVGGNTTTMAMKRLQRDVLSHHPSVVVIQFGINDSAYDVWKDPPATGPRVELDVYRENLASFIEQIRTQNGEVILMTPNRVTWTPSLRKLYGRAPYRSEEADGFTVMVDQYADAMREVAREKNVKLIDVHEAYRNYPQNTQFPIDTLLADGMHPNNQGHKLVADLLIKELQSLKP